MLRSNFVSFYSTSTWYIFDKTLIGGTAARIDIAGHSNVINPILDLNGEIEGHGYLVNFV